MITRENKGIPNGEREKKKKRISSNLFLDDFLTIPPQEDIPGGNTHGKTPWETQAVTAQLLIQFAQTVHLRTSTRAAANATAAIQRFIREARIDGPDGFTAQTVLTHLARGRDRGLSPKTLRNVLAFLTDFGRFLVDQGLLLKNPGLGIRLKKPAVRPPAYLDDVQLDRALAIARENGRYSEVALAAATGMRLGEMARLRWEDVDLPNKTVTVRQSKSGRWRIIPLSRMAIAALEEQRSRLQPRLAATRFPLKSGAQGGPPPGVSTERNADPDGQIGTIPFHVFPVDTLSRGGRRIIRDRPRDYSTWMAIMAPITAACPAFRLLKKGCVGRCWHMLRHTFATRHARAGTNLQKICEWMGHSDIRMTKIYVHLAQGYDADIELSP